MNGELDKVGCEYGRETRRQLEDFKRHCASVTARNEERLSQGSDRFAELDDEIKELGRRMDEMQTRLAWLIGACAAAGSFAAALLEKVLAHL